MRISDWSSDVCSSDLRARPHADAGYPEVAGPRRAARGGSRRALSRRPARPHGQREGHAAGLRHPPLPGAGSRTIPGDDFLPGARPMTSPAIITVAITGSQPGKAQNPAVPTTPAEQIESTHEAYEAGAALAHIHVRDAHGKPSPDEGR